MVGDGSGFEPRRAKALGVRSSHLPPILVEQADSWRRHTPGKGTSESLAGSTPVSTANLTTRSNGMIRPIEYYPSNSLERVCVPVEDFKDEAFLALVADLKETARAHHSHGLASNQIGGTLRVFVIRGDDSEYTVYVNPEITLEGDKVRNHEGCLSFPGATAMVERPEECTIYAADEKGDMFKTYFDDVGSVAIQHEFDHLDGKTVLDRISRLTKRMFLKKVVKYQKKYLRRI